MGVPGLSAATSDSRLANSSEAFDWNADAVRLVAEHGSDLISRHEPDGRYSYVNAAIERLTGFSPAETVNSHPLDLVHPADFTRVRRQMIGLLRRRSSDQFTFRIRHRDGHVVWVEVNCQVLRDAKGRAPREIVAITRDVTARELSTEAVRVQAARLDLAVASAGTGVWDWNVVTDELYWTPSMYRLCQADRNISLGRKGIIQKFLHPDDLVEFLDALDSIRSGAIREFKLVHRIVHPGGSVIWVDSRAQAVEGADGGVIRVVGLVNDITALKNQEAELADLAAKYALEKERAEAASISKSQFLANMSHELRTPLNAILGFAELMVSEFLGPLGHERYKGYASDIRDSGRHLLDLINDLLDMSRIEAGKLLLQRRALDIVEETRNCFRVLEVRAEKAGVRLEQDISGEVGPAYADRRAVRQILLNLLTNGVKFTDPGGTVRVEVTDDGADLRIDVSDSGCGIAARDVARIVEPFEQVETSQDYSSEGSGLGLALTKSLVELHEGKLSIDSKLGEGTTVSFTLPRADVQMTMFD